MLIPVRPRNGFAPVSLTGLLGWGGFYALFLLYAAANTSGFLFIDHANLMFHELGHALFSWAGYYTQILGGTIGQLLVPIACTAVFIWRRETAAVACCAFWTFQNLLYVATYMADARTSAMPLVGGDESDWTILFSHWGVLQQDRAIAAWVRGLGWIGMIGSAAWLVWMHFRTTKRA
jgi:hypothetical protein